MEREADRAASAVMGGRSAALTPASHVAVQRQPLAGAGATPAGESLIENASPMLAAAVGSVTVDGFDTGSAALDEKRMGRQIGELKKTAHNIVVLLRRYAASKVSVTGHTDTVGTEANNLELGMARANAVKAALVDLGVPEAIITVASKGEGPPQAVKTRDEASSARNRRAEVRFLPESRPSLPGPAVYQPPPVYQPAPASALSSPFPGISPGYSLPPPVAAPGPRAQTGPVAKVPPDVVRRITVLEEALERTADAVARDKIVRQIRDLVASIPQPFASKEEVVKGLDDAIKAGVTEGIKKAIQAALEAIAGQPATTQPSGPSHTLPLPSSAPGERIIPGPSIPFDYVPKPSPRTTFQFSGGPRASYAPGAAITFTLVPPDNFQTIPGSKRVVIVAAADRTAVNPDRLAQMRIESGSKQSITLVAPSKPGRYVIRVDIGMSFEDSSMQEFEVKSPAP
jgi:outer membrane protein OmpA-like peptidoglycan-associated protein